MDKKIDFALYFVNAKLIVGFQRFRFTIRRGRESEDTAEN